MAGKKKQQAFSPSRRIVLGSVLRETRFGQFTLAFLCAFLVCSVVIWLTGDKGETFFDGIWFSFQVVSTIGFGDITTTHFVARIIAMILSVISIFYLAILTGVVVSYFNQAIRIKQKNTLANYVSRLEHLKGQVPFDSRENIDSIIEKLRHLEDLSSEELNELAEQIKEEENSKLD